MGTPPAKLCKKVDFIIIIYDITNAKSFNNIDAWISQLKISKSDKKLMIIWGNKLYLPKSRVV